MTMDLMQKQRAVIEFLSIEGWNAADTHRVLRNVYGEATNDESNM